MEVLCFDVASGGVSGARIDEDLNVRAEAEEPWDLSTLSAPILRSAFESVNRQLAAGAAPAAIALSSFMHGFLVVDAAGNPVSPVLTWMDNADPSGVELIRSRIGEQFHERTGCRYHPMFP